MKGTLFADATFVQSQIKDPTVIRVQPLVAFNSHRMYLNDHFLRWESKNIVNCTYIDELNILLVLAEDCHLHVFNQKLQKISSLPDWDSKYIVGFQYVAPLNIFILIGITEIQVIKVTFITNIKTTKFLSSMKFTIKQQARYQVNPVDQLKWNKGYIYNLKHSILFVWSLQQIYSYTLPSLNTKFKFNDLGKKQNFFSAVFFSQQFEYTVLGYSGGDIKVWRLPLTQASIFKEKLIHNFTCHSKEVDQIISGGQISTIYAISSDLTVSFLSLKTLEQLWIFNYRGEYTKMLLRDANSAFAIKDNYLGLLHYGKKLQFIANIHEKVIFHSKKQKDTRLYHSNQTQTILLTLSNNLGLQFDASQLTSQKEFHKLAIQYIYPPLKTKNINQILECPYDKKIYLLAENGQICQIGFQNQIGKIQDSFNVFSLTDKENKTLKQEAKIIKFLKFLPPSFDTDTLQKINEQKRYYQTEEQKFQQLKMLTIGCSKGSIIFISLNNKKHIFARISYHREKIIHIESLVLKTRKQLLISICSEMYLKVNYIQDQKILCVTTIFCGNSINSLLGFSNILLIILQKGSFQICHFQDKRQSILLNNDAINHEGQILSYDIEQTNNLIITAGVDNKIKIWTFLKILIYEIKFDFGLQYCVLGQNLEFLILKNSKLCYLKDIPLKIKRQQIQTFNQIFIEQNVELQFTLRQFFENYLQPINDLNHKRKKLKFQMNIQEQNTIKKRYQTQKSEQYTHKRKPPIPKLQAIQNEETLQTNKRQGISLLDLAATQKHIQEMSSLKKKVHKNLFPNIFKKPTDALQKFVTQKIRNKRYITRTDMTSNQIILTNLLQDSYGKKNKLFCRFQFS